MDIAYAKIQDCVDIIPSLSDVQEQSDRLEASLMQSLLDSSRLIESELSLSVNYFKPADESFSIRIFYSDGTQFLRLNFPYIEIESIKDSDSEIVDTDFYRMNEFDVYEPRSYFMKWLYSSCGSRWWNWSPISINARWGFPCVPPDIVIAVRSMACLMFLNNPQTRAGLESSLTDNQEQRIRSTYNKVLDNWINKLHHRNLGIS